MDILTAVVQMFGRLPGGRNPMNLLLIDPAQRDGVPELYENLGLASLASAARGAGHETGTILTHLEGWSYRRLGREIFRRDPDVLGVSLLSYNARRTLQLLRRLKRDGLRAPVVVGGHFPTFNDEILLTEWPEIEAVVRGEGDITLVEMLQAWEAGSGLEGIDGITFRSADRIIRNPARSLLMDLDLLPWPARDHTDRIVGMGGTLHMARARGCYANCAFCSIASFYRAQGGPGWRQRSIDSVIAEMEVLADRHPGVEVKFLDDQFIGPGRSGREEAFALAEALIERDLGVSFSIFARADSVEPELFGALRAAGLKSVFVGVESGSQNQLDACGKRTSVAENRRSIEILHDLGIRFIMGLIFFDPYTEMDDVKANLAFLRDTQPLWSPRGNVLSIENRVIVYKGTPFHDRLREEGRLEGDWIDSTYTIRDRKVRWLSKLFHLLLKYILPGASVIRLLPAHVKLFRRRIRDRFGAILHGRLRPRSTRRDDPRPQRTRHQPATITFEKGVNS